jgi:hypothetical protein
VEFDPHFDAFWPAPDGQSLLLLKEDRNLFLFPLSGDEAGISLPFLLLPRENTILQLWWQNNGDILLLAGGSRRGDASTRLYRLDSGANLTVTRSVSFRWNWLESEDSFHLPTEVFWLF